MTYTHFDVNRSGKKRDIHTNQKKETTKQKQNKKSRISRMSIVNGIDGIHFSFYLLTRYLCTNNYARHSINPSNDSGFQMHSDQLFAGLIALVSTSALKTNVMNLLNDLTQSNQSNTFE